MHLREWWQQAKKRGEVYVVSEFRSRTNMGQAFSLYVVDDDGKLERAWPNDDNHDYSEKLARSLGFRNNSKMQAWYRGGCGYDRAHDVVYSIGRHFGDDLKSLPRIEFLGGM